MNYILGHESWQHQHGKDVMKWNEEKIECDENQVVNWIFCLINNIYRNIDYTVKHTHRGRERKREMSGIIY